MKKMISQFFKDFLICGACGWCMEILFTGLNQLRRRNMSMTGQSSLLMFPIYGMAALIRPIARFFQKKSFWVRGSIYTGIIFLGEFLSGSYLKKRGNCPWDYTKSHYHIRSIIRLYYAPYWFLAGLFFEQILRHTVTTGPQNARKPSK